jgi:hypothetical protein
MPEFCNHFPMEFDAIQAWVAAHRDELPTTLAELSRYPMPFRKVIVKTVPNDLALSWWIEHTQAILATEQGLTDEQRAFLEESVLVLPHIFGEGAEAEQAYNEWSKDPRHSLFDRDLAIRAFRTLGTPEPPGGLPLPPDALQFV